MVSSASSCMVKAQKLWRPLARPLSAPSPAAGAPPSAEGPAAAVADPDAAAGLSGTCTAGRGAGPGRSNTLLSRLVRRKLE